MVLVESIFTFRGEASDVGGWSGELCIFDDITPIHCLANAHLYHGICSVNARTFANSHSNSQLKLRHPNLLKLRLTPFSTPPSLLLISYSVINNSISLSLSTLPTMNTIASSNDNYPYYPGGITAMDYIQPLSNYSYYSTLLAQAHTELDVTAAADQQHSQLSELEQPKIESSVGILRLANPHHLFGLYALNM